MLFGGHVKSPDDLRVLQDLRFDFGEAVFGDGENRLFWRDSGVSSPLDSGFLLIAHGPAEGPPNDADGIRSRYLPALKDAVDTAACMGIDLLTIHLWMDGRFVKPRIIDLKKDALRDLAAYAREREVVVSLENLSEPASDLEPIVEAVPGLGLTLDMGHAQLLTEKNRSFEIIERLRDSIRHVHLHDNLGGNGAGDDLHLPVGEGIIDFPAILAELVKAGYDGTITLELESEHLDSARESVKRMIAGARSGRPCPK
jgi:sugar phosphate isomerase/epimerase